MISRTSARAIAELMELRFYLFHRTSRIGYRTPDSAGLYDFLYDRDYEAWFANLARKIYSPRETRPLKDFFLKLHTGETVLPATPDWSWEQRAELGQRFLSDLAVDLLKLPSSQPDPNNLKERTTNLQRSLELDGYVWDGVSLIQAEADALDGAEASGVVQTLYQSLGLSDEEVTFHHLKGSEEQYLQGKWDDSIANSRKFLESSLTQIAVRHAASKGNTLPLDVASRPVRVREYLHSEGLLAEKEKLALGAVYGLLSETGAHPYVAQQDQARLLRHLALTFTQFALLRLRGAGNTGS